MTLNLSLERGLSVLKLLRESEQPVGVRELARRLDLSAAAVQRILNTLLEQGYVEQDCASKRYRLGPALLFLAQHMLREDRLVRAARNELDRLADGCLNAFLGVRQGAEGIYLAAVQSRGPVVVRSSAGEKFPLHSTAMGKAFLLDFNLEQIIAIIGDTPLLRLTPRTVTDSEGLAKQIHASKSIGYTTSLEENFVGLIAVGAPVRDVQGMIVAAISVAYPKSVGPRLDITHVGETICAAADRISSSLGYRGGQLNSSEGSRNVA